MGRTGTTFCTIVARNYLAYALTLFASVQRFHHDAACYVLVVDGFDREIDPELDRRGILFSCPLDFLPYEMAMGLAYSYDITEYSTALKPFFLQYLLDCGRDSIIYLDPDILLLTSLEREVLQPLDEVSIVLTPHTTDPIPLDGRSPSEVTLLRAGAYNLGFIGVRATEESRRFLSWWSDRLERYCLNYVEKGFFVDQKWIDLVPGMYPNTHILTHPGLNVAYWNLHARSLIEGPDGNLRLKSNEPLVFFHFSGFDYNNPKVLSRHQNRIDVTREPALAKLLLRYAQELECWGHAERRVAAYAHGVFSDGTHVDNVIRAICREGRERGIVFPDPRDIDAHPSLFDYCNGTDSSDPGGTPRLTRYLATLHASRPDLQVAFPDPRGTHRQAFADWARADPHHRIDPKFIAAAFGPPRERSRGLPIVNVSGYFNVESGVGEAGRAHVSAVQAAGCDVHLLDFSATAQLSRQRESIAEGLSGIGSVNLVCVNADQVGHFANTVGEQLLRGRYNIASWWWELPAFPTHWRSSFEPFDEIWVGSEYVRGSISQISPVPVVRIPPVVAPPPIRDPSKERFGFPADAFVFLYLFDYLSEFERKNPLATVEAFRRAFPSRPDVRLILKAVNAYRDPQSAQRLAAACEGDFRIEVREAYLTRDEKNAMIAAADCYVSLHRAEGFGLTIAEAMYFGTSVICTGWSGNCDFANHSNALIVNAPLVTLGRDYGPYTAGQQWAEPDIEHAARLMRSVVDDALKAGQRADRARHDIRTKYSAEAVGMLARARLAEVLDLRERDL